MSILEKKQGTDMIKTLIVINFILILLSLGSGMFFLAKDSVRVTLSITLFVLLFAGYYFETTWNWWLGFDAYKHYKDIAQ